MVPSNMMTSISQQWGDGYNYCLLHSFYFLVTTKIKHSSIQHTAASIKVPGDSRSQDFSECFCPGFYLWSHVFSSVCMTLHRIDTSVNKPYPGYSIIRSKKAAYVVFLMILCCGNPNVQHNRYEIIPYIGWCGNFLLYYIHFCSGNWQQLPWSQV